LAPLGAGLKKIAKPVMTGVGGFLGGPAGAAIGSAVGGFVSNAQSSKQAREMGKFNASEATINREFQERMAGTAYQRKMEDLKSAGLNPALAYESGGAIAPSGSSASGSAARAENVGAPAVHSAQSAALARSELATQAATRDNIAAQTANIDAQRRKTDLLAPLEALVMTEDKNFKILHGKYLNTIGGIEDYLSSFRANVLRSEVERNTTSAAEARMRRRLLQLEEPKAESLADFYRSTFGKKIAPYLHSAREGSSVLRDLAIPSLLLRR